MNIIFTDLFKDECQSKFRITKKHVRKAITSSDAQEIVQVDDLVLGFFVNREVRPKDETYLLVCTRQKDNNWLVDLAFRMHPDLIDSAGTLEPLILLQALCQKFGLSIRIANQFNNFIFREVIHSEGRSVDPIKLVEVLNPSNHSFVQSMFIKFKPHHNYCEVNVALAYCIDTEEYLAWLFGNEKKVRKNQEVFIEITSKLQGYCTSHDLLAPEGTIEFKSNYSQIGGKKAGYLFKLSCENYHLEVGFTSTHFYIRRNDQILEWLIEPVYKPKGKIHCFAIWQLTQLSILILDEKYEEVTSAIVNPEDRSTEITRRTKTLETTPTIPPNSLLVWARKEAITPTTTYRSAEDFYEVVASSVQTIQDKVSTIGLHNPFWDITYDGSKILSRGPKHETDIHPTIHGFLFDIAIAKNFLINPEYQIAGGKLDFLISGTLSTYETVNACVEFKHAHSKDYLQGLLKQLPAYMKSKGCDFGIYCVLYFRGRHFPEPTEFDKDKLGLFLEIERRRAGLSNVRVIILDLSHHTPPSKL